MEIGADIQAKLLRLGSRLDGFDTLRIFLNLTKEQQIVIFPLAFSDRALYNNTPVRHVLCVLTRCG